ncbi:hypothetical protein LINGRAHAP2_LOCUS1836 [Linum grandiflorum]
MRWYVDDDGLSKASLVSEAEVDRLLKSVEDFLRLDSSENEDIDDVFDESLLPLQVETFEESQWFESRIESGKTLFHLDNQMFEEVKIMTSEDVSTHWILPSRNSGPPTVPPQLFDMTPQPQGIVIREPVEEEDYLDHSSPDTVLFKTPETVLHELGEQKVSSDEIMAEQCTLEADLLAHKLKDAADTLALASNSVSKTFKIGNSHAP